MIKIKIESRRMLDMLRMALINDKGIDAISGLISPTGIVFSDNSKGVIASQCSFGRSYFKEPYDVDETREINFKAAILKGLSDLKFGSEDETTFEIDGQENNFRFRAGSKKWDPPMSAFKELGSDNLSVDRIVYGLGERAGIGILPTDADQPIFAQFKIDPSKLVIPDVEKVTFTIAEDKSLAIDLDYSGPFSETLTPTEVRTMTPGKWTLVVELLKHVLANFKGEVWVTVYEQFFFFTMSETEYSLMYLLSVT